MVLHNSKWDRRAKTKYMKKHGVTAEELKKKSKKCRISDEENNPSDLENTWIEKNKVFSDDVTEEADAASLGPSQVEQFDLLPDYEENSEENELIRKHIAQFQLKKEEPKSHIQRVDRSVFAQAHAGVERSKLNQRVKNIGKRKQQFEIDLESDSDFDEFMDNLEDTHEQQTSLPATLATNKSSGVKMDERHMVFVDNLLN